MLITRFAPSPTGNLHLGGARIALFSWLIATKNQGKLITRIDDTDVTRCSNLYLKNIIQALNWLEMFEEKNVFYQSLRKNIYDRYAFKLLKEKLAYRCYCEKDCLGHCRHKDILLNRPYVIRLKLDQGITWKDKILGPIKFYELHDYIIARTDGSYTYNFTTVVDDIDMGITDIIRGADHISNTGKQAILFFKLQAKCPNFYHVPLIISETGGKLAKRQANFWDVIYYKEQGILSLALKNYLFRMGCSHGNQEIFSISEMIDVFNPEKINKSSVKMDNKKLYWFNKNHMILQSVKLAKELKIPTFLFKKAAKKLKDLNSIKKCTEFIFKEPDESIVQDTQIINCFLKIYQAQKDPEKIWNELKAYYPTNMLDVCKTIKHVLTGYNDSFFSIQDILKSLSEKKIFNRINRALNNKNIKSLVFPPPNITGSLHIGHGFQQILMDIICKQNYMQHKIKINWIPGFDHAGIATYLTAIKMFPQIAEIDEKIEKLKNKSIEKIRYQMQRIDLDIDWTKAIFTMNERYKNAVNTCFKILYDNSLIYRGEKLVYWDFKAKTAISDSEVNFKQEKSVLFYIYYIMKQSPFTKIIVATTRVETIYADQAIAIHPEDKRYKHLIGKEFIVPISGHTVKLIQDKAIDPNFGSGAVKITPGHSFVDEQIGNRHRLKKINLINNNGFFTCYPVVGLNTEQARKKTIDLLEKDNLIHKRQDHVSNVPIGERTGKKLEILITKQWFVKTDILAKKASQFIKEDKIQFFPQKYKRICLQYLDENYLNDWCISRQIPWGHRIPIWYKEDGSTNTKGIGNQDKDVLDTWFSSSIWPLVISKWPQELDKYYPHTFVITGEDILFFWVSRMIMMCGFLTNKIPFRQVCITGIVRDEYGQKMSKSKGNVIDFLDIVDGISYEDLVKKRTLNLSENKKKDLQNMTKKQWPKGIEAYGVDVLRLALTSEAVESRDINFSQQSLSKSKYLYTKLKNAIKFVAINHEKTKPKKEDIDPLTSWLGYKIKNISKQISDSLAVYKFHTASKHLYDLICKYFCKYYLEFIKTDINSCSSYNLGTAIYKIGCICYPFIPNISKKIIELFIKFDQQIVLKDEFIKSTEILKTLVDAINRYRSRLNYSKRCNLLATNTSLIKNYAKNLDKLCNISDILESKKIEDRPLITYINNIGIYIDHKEYKPFIIARLKKLQEKEQKLKTKLENDQFIKKGNPQAIQKAYQQQQQILEEISIIKKEING